MKAKKEHVDKELMVIKLFRRNYARDLIYEDGEHQVFVDVNSIGIGETWSDTIESNISKCDIFIVIVTPAALKSKPIENEVLQAQRERKTIIPCFYKQVNKKNPSKWDLDKIQGIEFDNVYNLMLELPPKIEEKNKQIKKLEIIEKSYPPIKILKDKEVLDHTEIFMDNVKEKMDICLDKRASSYVVSFDTYINGYKKMREKSKIRAITEIDEDNIEDCIKLKGMVDELCHLNGIKCGIAVSEDQFISTTYSVLEQLQNTNKDMWLNDAIYSQQKEIIQHNQFIFDTLWKNATPAEIRFKEIKK